MGYAERNNPRSLKNGKRYKSKVKEKTEPAPEFSMAEMAVLLSKMSRKKIQNK